VDVDIAGVDERRGGKCRVRVFVHRVHTEHNLEITKSMTIAWVLFCAAVGLVIVAIAVILLLFNGWGNELDKDAYDDRRDHK
jgi:hypothetical protein